MQTGQPSRTAYSAARHRAAHQVLESGRIFTDPLALRILGGDPDEIVREAEADPTPGHRFMRLFIAVRSRFAEDSLAAAVSAGTRQLVVLGAGLDTFAYRNPHDDAGLRVFEVDHPATQGWKRSRLAEAGLAAPQSLTFAPVDFENETLADGLATAGFDTERAAFFTWLGVVPYLTREAVFSTLGYIAELSGGAQVVFDYGEPPAAIAAERRATYEARARRVAAIGEPWLSYFSPTELAEDLRRLGFDEIEDLWSADIAVRYFGASAGQPRQAGGHVIRAASGPSNTSSTD